MVSGNASIRFLFLAALLCASEAVLNNQVTQWQVAAQQTVAALSVPSHLASRLYGAIGIAQYESVKSFDRRTPDNVRAAAAAYAGHQVLSGFFPFRQSPVYDGLLAAQIAALNLTSSANRAAYAVASKIAGKVLINRVSDGMNAWANFIPAPANVTASIGKYQYAPGQTFSLYPQLADARPYVTRSSELFKITAKYRKHDLKSDAYLLDLKQVTEVGVANSTARTQYDTDSIRFWADGAGTSGVGGHFMNISYLVLPGTTSLLQSAKFYAAFGAATFDASIACWRVKYRELFWRPVTAIRNGDGVNAPITNWTPQLATPPHPEYPSGHQCTAGAALAVLQAFLGRDDVAFTIGSEGAVDLSRTYTSLTAAAVEQGASRTFAGVHFSKSNADGLQLGMDIARAVLKTGF